MRQIVPDRDQGLLKRVLGEVMVAQDPVGDREQPAADESRQPLEGLLFATRRAFHEFSLHVVSITTEHPDRVARQA